MNNKSVKYILPLALWFITFLSFGWSFTTVVGCTIFFFYFLDFLFKIGEEIAFIPFILFLFSINYLFAPALMYNGLDELQFYRMSIPEEQYFGYAIPAILLMHLGMRSIKTNIFNRDLTIARTAALLNTGLLKKWIVAGLVLKVISSLVPSELGFFCYLLSGIRFVGAFGLYTLNKKKYIYYILVVFAYEIIVSLAGGVFHDFLMWLIFFGLLAAYLYKPLLWQKIVVLVAGIIGVFILQLTKNDYRARQNQEGGTTLSSFSDAVESTEEKSNEGFFSLSNGAQALTRVNQAWIFASTVNNMDHTQDFQNGDLIYRYFEAAILPRFLAPNKIKAGDKETFNRFSGKSIGEGTSMGLGILADGYISYGEWGVYLFTFGFGLLLALVFRVVQNWSNVSPFFIFFIFPMLNFAVRPDCETQTVIGHIFKSLFVIFLVVRYSKKYFKKQFKILEARGEGDDDEETTNQEYRPGDFSLQPA